MQPVAEMLYYGDMNDWPGGNGGDRSHYYPRKTMAGDGRNTQFWETDITPLMDRNQVRPESKGWTREGITGYASTST
jgi:hypothetical protein